ncbi:unnamed protein product [Nezara viridula]|uniref:Uncharacterized protein n=1 Tax=Nezara viridula TaxID=85310 RepID=A0A9P0H3F3_NEZVI|nr:unnamed protein product [Nezara viridula]
MASKGISKEDGSQFEENGKTDRNGRSGVACASDSCAGHLQVTLRKVDQVLARDFPRSCSPFNPKFTRVIHPHLFTPSYKTATFHKSLSTSSRWNLFHNESAILRLFELHSFVHPQFFQ